MEANRTVPVPKSVGGGKKKDVFKGFEYISSRYSLADEVRRKVSACPFAHVSCVG